MKQRRINATLTVVLALTSLLILTDLPSASVAVVPYDPTLPTTSPLPIFFDSKPIRPPPFPHFRWSPNGIVNGLMANCNSVNYTTERGQKP